MEKLIGLESVKIKSELQKIIILQDNKPFFVIIDDCTFAHYKSH